MIYPVNHISISQGHHTGKCLDFGWWVEKYRYQPIIACDSGKVKKTEKQPNGGNVIYLEHNDGTISCYAHLDKILVKKGQKVSLGQQIGTMGNSGKTTGMHLHFGLYSKGKNIYGNADLDPFNLCEVYEGQEVRQTGTTKKYLDRIKYHKEKYQEGYYELLFDKYLRKTPNLGNNIVKVKDTTQAIRNSLTSKNKYANAKIKKGTTITILEIYTDKESRVWGRNYSGWVVLQNMDGTPQAIRKD